MSLGDKIEALHDSTAPNEVALELLKGADEINGLIAVVRDHDGKLHVLWTAQDLGELSEASMALTTAVQDAIRFEHEIPVFGGKCDTD